MTPSSVTHDTGPGGAKSNGDRASAWRDRFAPVAGGAVLVGMLALVLLPVVYIIFGSFRSAPPGSDGANFTLANWQNVYGASEYLEALGHTVLLSAVVAVLSVIVGTVLAWIIARTDAPGRGALALLLVLPLMISHLVTTLAWIALAAPNAGFINAISRETLGIRTIVNIYSFTGMVWVMVLHYASFAFVAAFAALRSIDSTLEEAAETHGASPLETLAKVTLPLIWPTLASTLLMIFVFAAENFSVPALLGTPVNYATLSSRIFSDMAITPARPTMAATAGTMLLWLAVVGIVWQRRILARANRYVTVGGKGTHRRLVQLGAWRGAATGFIILFLVLAVFLPYAVLVLGSFLKFLTPNIRVTSFTLDNYAKVFDLENIGPLRNSLLLSAGGGLLLTVLYIGAGKLALNLKARYAALVDYVAILPTAIPALVLGVGLVWAFVGVPLPIYGTMSILVIAYFIRFIGFGMRHATNAMVQVAPELGEAAAVSGASGFEVFRHVTLPIVRPAVLSLWTLLFIFIFMEISATILLYGPDTATLPTMLWNYMASGFQTRAFAVAVVQATLIFVILAITDRKLGVLRASLER